jgi:hypothetical protein
MMKGLTLSQLAAKIEGNAALKHDMIVDTRTLSMQLSPRVDETLARPVFNIPGEGNFPILPLAHNQIGARLNIPSKYYDRMLHEAPDLLAHNVNTWFQQQPEKRMVRTLGGDTRAFLSNRYQRIENDQIARIALPILADIPDVQIVSSEITERRMYIQAVCPRIQGEVKKGDVVQAGVVIGNSEVGHGSVNVAEMDWRLVCLNGAISAEKFRAYHVGRQIEDNSELWADDTKAADDSAVLLKVRDMVRAAVDGTRFRARLERMQGLTQITCGTNVEGAVEVLAQKVNATDEERGGILRALIEGGDLSAWGLLNAVTAQAHTAKNYDRAVEFEAAGGQLLSLNRTEWREILEAA